MEGEGLVHFNHVSVYLGRQREVGVPDQKNTLHTHILHFCFVNIWNSSAWGRNYKQGPLHHSVYLVDTDISYIIKWTRPAPSVFAYCKQSNTGWWEDLGARLDRNIVTSTSRHASMIRAYWSRLMINPFTSFFNLTGNCPSSFINCMVLSITDSSVQGAGTISTRGI